MNPLCPINQIGIRHPVMCSDGYMYEEKCLQGWMKKSKTSPITRQPIEFVKRCKIDNKCYNEFSDCEIEEEYFCKSIKLDVLDYSKNRGVYNIKINFAETEDETELIIDVDKILNDIDKTCATFLVEKYVNILCKLNKCVVFLKVKDSNCFNSSKIVYNENKSELLIVR